MIRRLAIALPLALGLGCAAAPPPAAAPPSADDPRPSTATPKVDGGPAASAAPDAVPRAPATAEPAGGKTGVGKAAVTPTDAPLISNISQSEVMAQVAKSADLFNKCYSIGAGASKTWRAKVTIKATVGPSGAVNTADVMTSTAKNPQVDACVIDAFKKLSFPRPKNSGTTTFTFPLSFDGVEQVQ